MRAWIYIIGHCNIGDKFTSKPSNINAVYGCAQCVTPHLLFCDYYSSLAEILFFLQSYFESSQFNVLFQLLFY